MVIIKMNISFEIKTASLFKYAVPMYALLNLGIGYCLTKRQKYI